MHIDVLNASMSVAVYVQCGHWLWV